MPRFRIGATDASVTRRLVLMEQGQGAFEGNAFAKENFTDRARGAPAAYRPPVALDCDIPGHGQLANEKRGVAVNQNVNSTAIPGFPSRQLVKSTMDNGLVS